MKNVTRRQAHVSPEVMSEVRAGKRRMVVMWNLDGPIAVGDELTLLAEVSDDTLREVTKVTEVHKVGDIFIVLISDSPLDDVWALDADGLVIIGPESTSKWTDLKASVGVPFWQAVMRRLDGKSFRAISNESARDAVRQLVRTVRQAGDE